MEKSQKQKNAENEKKRQKQDSADMTLSSVPILNIGSADMLPAVYRKHLICLIFPARYPLTL